MQKITEMDNCRHRLDKIEIDIKSNDKRKINKKYTLNFNLCVICQAGFLKVTNSKFNTSEYIVERDTAIISSDRLPNIVQKYLEAYFDKQKITRTDCCTNEFCNNRCTFYTKIDMTWPDKNGMVFIWETYISTKNKTRLYGWINVIEAGKIFLRLGESPWRYYQKIIEDYVKETLQGALQEKLNNSLINIIADYMYRKLK